MGLECKESYCHLYTNLAFERWTAVNPTNCRSSLPYDHLTLYHLHSTWKSNMELALHLFVAFSWKFLYVCFMWFFISICITPCALKTTLMFKHSSHFPCITIWLMSWHLGVIQFVAIYRQHIVYFFPSLTNLPCMNHASSVRNKFQTKMTHDNHKKV